MRPHPAPLAAILLGGVLLAGAGPLAAQERSPTGRHRPPPPPPAAAADLATAGESRWTVNFGLGAVDGGDLLRVATLDGLPVAWDPDHGGGFRSSRYLAELAPGPGLVLGAGRRLGRRLGMRAELGWSRHEVMAEADLGQLGAVHRFDRWNVFAAGLDLEVRLVQAPSHPYLAVGGGVVSLDPDAASGLAQTGLEARLALGYRFDLGRISSVRLEAFAARSGFSADGWAPVSLNSDQPPVEMVAEDHLQRLGLLLVFQTALDP